MIVQLRQIDEKTRRQIEPLTADPAKRTVAFVHGLYIGGTKDEREQRIQRNVRAYAAMGEVPPGLEAGIRAEEDEYLTGLQESLDNRGYPVGIVFESVDTMHRVQQLVSMDNTGRPWLVIPTHVRGADPTNGETWTSTIERLRQLGVQNIDVGGCYCVVDNDNRFVSSTNQGDYSCVNNVLERLRDSRAFRSVGLLTKGTYFTLKLPNG